MAIHMGVWIRWNGTVEWNGGMDWTGMEWNGMAGCSFRGRGQTFSTCTIKALRKHTGSAWGSR